MKYFISEPYGLHLGFPSYLCEFIAFVNSFFYLVISSNSDRFREFSLSFWVIQESDSVGQELE